MSFEWDETKAQANLVKYGIAFSEAKSVFDDPLAILFDDVWHSTDERREIIIGHDRTHRLLLISFTERAGKIRIISICLATPKERRDYEEYRGF